MFESKARKLPPRELRKRVPSPEEVAAVPRKPIVFVLDSVWDTFNVGALFRVADAVAAERVVLCGETPTPPNPKIHKAAVGTENWLPWTYKASVVEALKELKAQGYALVAVEQHPRSVWYVEFRGTPPAALIVGHESRGITPEALELVDAIVELPMLGVTRSLTVAAAAAVVAYKLLENEVRAKAEGGVEG